MTNTREKLKKHMHLAIPMMDTNQIASTIGSISEQLVCKFFNWEKNGDIGNEKGYDATDKDGNKYEIKSMSYESKTPYVPYIHSKKKDRYDYLVIVHYDEERCAIISHEDIEKFIEDNILPGRKTKTFRLMFDDPLLTSLGKPRKKSRFLQLFLDNEIKDYKHG